MNEVEMVEELFRKYKAMTEDMIDKFNNSISINGILTDRKKILEQINDVKISGKEKKSIYISLGIDKLDEALENLLNNSYQSIKEEIRMNKIRRKTVNAYNKTFDGYNFLSRKV